MLWLPIFFLTKCPTVKPVKDAVYLSLINLTGIAEHRKWRQQLVSTGQSSQSRSAGKNAGAAAAGDYLPPGGQVVRYLRPLFHQDNDDRLPARSDYHTPATLPDHWQQDKADSVRLGGGSGR